MSLEVLEQLEAKVQTAVDNIALLKMEKDELQAEIAQLKQENQQLRNDHQAWQERLRALLGKMLGQGGVRGGDLDPTTGQDRTDGGPGRIGDRDDFPIRLVELREVRVNVREKHLHLKEIGEVRSREGEDLLQQFEGVTGLLGDGLAAPELHLVAGEHHRRHPLRGQGLDSFGGFGAQLVTDADHPGHPIVDLDHDDARAWRRVGRCRFGV